MFALRCSASSLETPLVRPWAFMLRTMTPSKIVSINLSFFIFPLLFDCKFIKFILINDIFSLFFRLVC